MKLLVTMKLADRSLKHHIDPIVELNEVEKVLIVRDYKGPDINKVEYHCPPNWTLKIPILALISKFLLMLLISVREGPDLIHGYLLFPHGILAFICGKLTRKKIGISLIAGPVETYVLNDSPINKYSYCKPLPKLSIISKLLIKTLKSCDYVTVTGNYTKDFLTEKGVYKKNIFILPHVLDDRFKFINCSKDYDIVYVGRLAGVKHVETLIKSIYLIKENLPKIKVLIVGDGESKAELENLSKKCSLSYNIHFVGYQSDVWNWYNKGKISILTSEREGFPYSVVEALQCGLPVISSNCGDVSDLIENEYNGFIVSECQDYCAFAEVILKILSKPEKILDYSKNALESVENRNSGFVSLIWKSILIKTFYENNMGNT